MLWCQCSGTVCPFVAEAPTLQKCSSTRNEDDYLLQNYNQGKLFFKSLSAGLLFCPPATLPLGTAFQSLVGVRMHDPPTYKKSY
jgi:hypothetical protein